MKIEVIENPPAELVDFFEKRIEEFNVARWEIKAKSPVVFQIKNQTGEIVAGAGCKSFGNWMMLDNLWVSENLRGQDIGSQLLKRVEQVALERGCKYVLLETLNFQARPFYEKFGYKLQWTQNEYPKIGAKHFMVKDLL